jgi:hypothetical protein
MDTWTFDIPATRNSSARPRAPTWTWSAAGGRIANIDGLGPLVRDDDIVALGEREDYLEWRDIHDTDITVWDLWKMRSLGVNRVALKTLEKMESSGVEGFWVHLEVPSIGEYHKYQGTIGRLSNQSESHQV